MISANMSSSRRCPSISRMVPTISVEIQPFFSWSKASKAFFSTEKTTQNKLQERKCRCFKNVQEYSETWGEYCDVRCCGEETPPGVCYNMCQKRHFWRILKTMVWFPSCLLSMPASGSADLSPVGSYSRMWSWQLTYVRGILKLRDQDSFGDTWQSYRICV